MTLHDLFTLLNLPIGTLGHDMTQPLLIINIGVQYIIYKSEYISKLQLHQHPCPSIVYWEHQIATTNAQVTSHVKYGF